MPRALPARVEVGLGAPQGRTVEEGTGVRAHLRAMLMLLALACAPALAQAKLLVPMDDAQTNHLKAYGLTFWVLQRGEKCEWLLNYRGGSFLLPGDEATVREANIRGVTSQPVSGAEEAKIRATIADENMEAVELEKAPK